MNDVHRVLQEALEAARDPRRLGEVLPDLLVAIESRQDDLGTHERGILWHLRGILAWRRDDDVPLAAHAFQRSLELLEAADAPEGAAYAGRVFDTLGQMLQHQGLLEDARRELEEALARKVAARDEEGVALTHGSLGRLCLELGDFRAAGNHFQEDLAYVVQHTPNEGRLRGQLLTQLGSCRIETGEQRGDVAKAMQSYRAYFRNEELEFVDPHLRFQAFLKLQNGVAGAREAYYDMKQATPNVATRFAWNLLLDGEARVQGLEAFLEERPEFAPAYYALSRDFSVARLGSQTMADKRDEKKLLERFLELQSSGEFLRYYLDQAEAVRQVEDAKERLAALSSLTADLMENPVGLTASLSSAGWTISLSIADTVKEIFYRLGNEGEFRSTGFYPRRHPQTGLPAPQLTVSLPKTAGRTLVQVKYTDPRGREHGPYDLEFDPTIQRLQESKSILDLTKNAWVSFRDWDEKVLVYFSHLLGHRGVLSAIRYGIDTETPDQSFPFSAADPKNPYAIGENDTIYIDVPLDTKYVTVQLTYKDGSKSDVMRFDR